MDIVFSFFSNPWVIGIAGGIISSLLVYGITNFILSKRENREYLQKVNAANNEILYTIRPLIVDKTIPDYNVVSSLIISTAQKFQVNQNDIYTRETLVNDIIKEVLENPFLSTSAKMEYCNSVQQLICHKNEEIIEKNSEDFQYTEQKSSYVNIISILMSIMAGLAVSTLAIVDLKLLSDKEKLTIILIILLLTLLSWIVVFSSYIKIKKIRNDKDSSVAKLGDEKNQ